MSCCNTDCWPYWRLRPRIQPMSCCNTNYWPYWRLRPTIQPMSCCNTNYWPIGGWGGGSSQWAAWILQIIRLQLGQEKIEDQCWPGDLNSLTSVFKEIYAEARQAFYIKTSVVFILPCDVHCTQTVQSLQCFRWHWCFLSTIKGTVSWDWFGFWGHACSSRPK